MKYNNKLNLASLWISTDVIYLGDWSLHDGSDKVNFNQNYGHTISSVGISTDPNVVF